VIPFPDLAPALPEITLALGGLVLLMIGVFAGEKSIHNIISLAVLLFLVAGLTVVAGPSVSVTTFGGLYVTDGFAVFMKLVVLAGALLTLVMSIDYIDREGMARFEYPVLFVFAVTGMMAMVSASNLMTLYLGLELQSLSLYVIASFQRDSLRSTEAGLKYFVLGALSSGMLLYGASLVYGFSGTTDFTGIARLFGTSEGAPLALVIGMVFICAGIAFKMSAVPFHMWTPDVYEGAPTPVTAFFAVAPKVAAMALFIRVLTGPFGGLVDRWQQIVVAVAILSMVLGAFAAIAQSNIKRLMAYSSIGHIGFALVGLAAGTPEGVTAVMVYLAIYVAMNVGTFAVILMMRRDGIAVETIEDLRGFSRGHPMAALALTILMFSMAGIPPMAGFFAKLYVFQAAVASGLYALAVIGVVASVVSAFYYLRIIKLMYFDEPAAALDRSSSPALDTVLTVSAGFTVLFWFFPAPIVSAAAAAARTLFPS
jgi:NADH-quinone oxidoreductase subunit N